MNHRPDSHYLTPPQPLRVFPALLLPPPTDFLAEGLAHKQRKKRTKLVPVDSPTTGSCGVQKKKYTKPDPGAPKITRPCSECGKKFWSWKALFGHMRCHPERQWRGINPPPSVRPRPHEPLEVMAVAAAAASSSVSGVEMMTEEDHKVAACLLLLANGGNPVEFPRLEPACPDGEQGGYESAIVFRYAEGGGVSCNFECSCCKKVFGSHQAPGGHIASHKNVKGCFANTRPDEEGLESECSGFACNAEPPPPLLASPSTALVLRHSCSICSRVFSSGQALGGRMRCHWEKSNEPHSPHFAPSTPQCTTSHNPLPAATTSHPLVLNMPAPFDHFSSSSTSSNVRLDLMLGL